MSPSSGYRNGAAGGDVKSATRTVRAKAQRASSAQKLSKQKAKPAQPQPPPQSVAASPPPASANSLAHFGSANYNAVHRAEMAEMARKYELLRRENETLRAELAALHRSHAASYSQPSPHA